MGAMTREQIHATLSLKGYERCGSRAYFIRTKEYCLVFTAGAARPAPQPADWRPFTPPHQLMATRFAAQIWEAIEKWNARGDGSSTQAMQDAFQMVLP